MKDTQDLSVVFLQLCGFLYESRLTIFFVKSLIQELNFGGEDQWVKEEEVRPALWPWEMNESSKSVSHLCTGMMRTADNSPGLWKRRGGNADTVSPENSCPCWLSTYSSPSPVPALSHSSSQWLCRLHTLSMSKDTKSQQKGRGDEFQEGCIMANPLVTHRRWGDMHTAEWGSEPLWRKSSDSFLPEVECSRSELTLGTGHNESLWGQPDSLCPLGTRVSGLTC